MSQSRCYRWRMADLPDDLVRLVPALRQWASAQSQVGRLWLYGSRVKGTHRPDSDLDVAVSVNALLTTGADKERFWATLIAGSAELSAACNLRVSVQCNATPGVDAGVAESGVLIYEREP